MNADSQAAVLDRPHDALEKLSEATEQGRSRLSTSLVHGLNLLGTFSAERRDLSLSELAEMTGMSKSTAHRYIRTLVALSYLEQDPRTRYYRLGMKVLDLGAAAINSMGLVDIARPYLRELWDETQLTIDLAVLDHGDIVFLEMLKNPRGAVLDVYVGSRLPAYCTAPGKVLLAFLPRRELLQTLESLDLLPKGPNTITDRSRLMEALEEIRQTGLARNNEETVPGLRTVAVPIRDASGKVVAATSIASYRGMDSFDDPAKAFAAALKATAAQISAKLGYRPSAENSEEMVAAL